MHVFQNTTVNDIVARDSNPIECNDNARIAVTAIALLAEQANQVDERHNQLLERCYRFAQQYTMDQVSEPNISIMSDDTAHKVHEDIREYAKWCLLASSGLPATLSRDDCIEMLVSYQPFRDSFINFKRRSTSNARSQ